MRDKLLERKYQKYQKFYLHMIFSFFFTHLMQLCKAGWTELQHCYAAYIDLHTEFVTSSPLPL